MAGAARPSVVVTRPEPADGPLSTLLAERGFEVLHWQAVRHEPPHDDAPMANGLEKLATYDWIVFTSPRAVAAVVERCPQPQSTTRVAAVGTSTAAAVAAAGWAVDLTPARATAADLVAAFRTAAEKPGRVFFPASDLASAVLESGLEAMGFTVDRVDAYRTVPTDLDRDRCLTDAQTVRPAAVTFASPSAVRSLHETLGGDAFNQILDGAVTVAIGPVTAAALERLGRLQVTTADDHSLPGLADAVAAAVGAHQFAKEA